MTSLSRKPRIETGVAGSIVGGGGDATAGKVNELQVVQKVLDGDEQGFSLGVTAPSVGATTGSAYGEAGGGGSMSGSVSLAATRRTQNPC
jgi:hypothetical protein